MREAGADCLGEAPKGVMKDSFWKKEQKIEEKAVNGQEISLKLVCVSPTGSHQLLFCKTLKQNLGGFLGSHSRGSS